jgi:HPt (histidine-containing phosphotransfer) domain-containing protein
MDSAAQTALAEALDLMWARFLPEIKQRVAVLEAAAAAFSSGVFAPADQEAAAAAAHKLAGVLGTFGLAQGTALARELETIYSLPSAPQSASGVRLVSIAAQLRVLVESRNPAAEPASN